MKAPISWINDFVDVKDLSLEEIAKTLTMLGLEVEGIQLVGMAMPAEEKHEFKYEGLSWPEDKFVVASVDEVMPHPDADRLVLCRLFDGSQELIVLTGAPNLYPYKEQGKLEKPLKVAYAREGSILYDGHQPGLVKTKLKKMKIRGVESFSMICSEKELGISDEHEGVIILDDDAPAGMPLVDYMGDAVFDIAILPNMARDACIVSIARELAAATKRPLRTPQAELASEGEPITGKVSIEIEKPELNPRFVLGLVESVEQSQSPYWVKRRLALAGMRPINAVVDATNYTMLELGNPLHAFDYDVLVERASGKSPTIITRTAKPGEQLTTLDGNTHTLEPYMELVCDTAGALSLAGVMGGAESEVTSQTANVLIEGASWNFINIRKTLGKLKINSEAGYRFSRGIHPALADLAVSLCLDRIENWSGGKMAVGLVDNYPLPPIDPVISLSEAEIERFLGVKIPTEEVVDIMTRLGFKVEVHGEQMHFETPPTRLDINPGLVGKADLIEEIARIYGYDRIPSRRLASQLPPQVGNRALEVEEILRDLLINLGLQDTVTYRQTSPAREARIWPGNALQDPPEYVEILNPITPERSVLRRSILSTMLEVLEHNVKHNPHLAMFDLGPIFISKPEQLLPDEVLKLAIGLTGLRMAENWQIKSPAMMDFYDLKGVVEEMLHGLHIQGISYKPANYANFHPGKCAEVYTGERILGVLGELHPLVKVNYHFEEAPVLLAEFDGAALIELSSIDFHVKPISTFPAMVEDIAIIVDEEIQASDILSVIQDAGGKLLVDVQLFDIYRNEKIGLGKKSMAYKLTYQAYDRTLTDKDALTIRTKIVKALARQFNAVLRSQ